MSISPASSQSFLTALWQLLTHPLFIGSLLLLPAVFFLQPLPIDETRYLAVAWEMRQTGEFLVPHLNGAAYSHKPPLLFWLINMGWLSTGVHAWTARAMTLLCSLTSLWMLKHIALRLGLSEHATRWSMWLLLGAIYFGVFANAIMFDVLLATCVLGALLGLLDIEQGRVRRGVLITGIAIGLGILAKGPVMLLDMGFVAATAPWWSERVRNRRGAFFGAVGLSMGLGVAIALAWAIPAALHGGTDYAHAIFLHQTVDRVSSSFAHRRPLWWYVGVLPLMVLPWPLVLRFPITLSRWWPWARVKQAVAHPSPLKDAGPWRSLLEERAVRFALGWVVPTFIVFSLISGKQPHYLLPLLPGLALLAGIAIDRGVVHVRLGLFGFLLLIGGLILALLPHYALSNPELVLFASLWPIWGILIALCGIVVIALRQRFVGPVFPAIACLLVVLISKFALLQGLGTRYDVQAVAEQVKAAQNRGQAIVHLEWHHGVYEFAGRLTQPLPTITLDKFAAYAQANPEGLVMSFDRRHRFKAAPIYQQPFRGGTVSIWRAKDAVVAGIDSADAQNKDDDSSSLDEE